MTIKTKAELTALFANNTTGDISPQDLRDFLDSIMGVYGGIDIDTAATAQAVVAATPELMTEWQSNSVNNGVTPDYTSNNITIDNDGVYEVSFGVSFDGITGAVQEFHLRKNGIDTGHGCEEKTANNDTTNASMSMMLSLVATDVLTIWVESDATGSFTAKHGNFIVKRIG